MLYTSSLCFDPCSPPVTTGLLLAPGFLHPENSKHSNNNEKFAFHHNLKIRLPSCVSWTFFVCLFQAHLPNTLCIMVNMEDVLL